jgi:hypothetical protein
VTLSGLAGDVFAEVAEGLGCEFDPLLAQLEASPNTHPSPIATEMPRFDPIRLMSLSSRNKRN